MRASASRTGDGHAERIFDPLGMPATGFSVRADKLSRLTDCYSRRAAARG
jgi:CubicO group peptidase (beta-lactamase class C family)